MRSQHSMEIADNGIILGPKWDVARYENLRARSEPDETTEARHQWFKEKLAYDMNVALSPRSIGTVTFQPLRVSSPHVSTQEIHEKTWQQGGMRTDRKFMGEIAAHRRENELRCSALVARVSSLLFL